MIIQIILRGVLGITTAVTAFGQAAPIQYSALRRGQSDCDTAKPPVSVCRVRRMPAENVLRAHLKKGESSWREKNEIVFAYQGDADSIEFYGGSSWLLTKLPGTNLWTLILQVPEIEQAEMSYQFMVVKGDDVKIEPPTPQVYRGKKASPAPRQASELRGRITEENFQSSNLSEARAVVIYSPPLKTGESVRAVVYIADGKAVRLMASYVEPLILARRLPPILLVGIDHGKVLPGDPQINDYRALEYLLGFGKTDERFEAHERFLTSEILPWAESKFGAPTGRTERAIFGASNGGSFALSMGIRHPEIFGHVIAFSPTNEGNLSVPNWTGGQAPTQYLLAGKLESSVSKLVIKWSETAKKADAVVIVKQPVAGHDSVVWREQFPAALLAAFGK